MNITIKKHKIDIVNLEGGAGAYDTGIFNAIRNKKAKKEITSYFVNTGDINGAEYYAVNNSEEIKLWGVEKKEYLC